MLVDSLVSVATLALSGRALDNVIDAQDHLCGIVRRHDHLQLGLVRLEDAQLAHVARGAGLHVQAHLAPLFLGVVQRAELRHQLGRVVAGVVGDDGGDGAQASASLPGTVSASSSTARAISISEQPPPRTVRVF